MYWFSIFFYRYPRILWINLIGRHQDDTTENSGNPSNRQQMGTGKFSENIRRKLFFFFLFIHPKHFIFIIYTFTECTRIVLWASDNVNDTVEYFLHVALPLAEVSSNEVKRATSTLKTVLQSFHFILRGCKCVVMRSWNGSFME